MSLAEKVGQMTQITLTRLMGQNEWDRGPLNEQWLKRVLVDNHVGSVLSGGGASPVPNNPETWAAVTNTLQQWAVEKTRLGIPIVYGIDAVHGHNNVLGATLFPHQIGLAATWDPKLVEEAARVTAQAVRATGIHWNFAPVADVGRDFRWGRFYETFGEDPYLASELVAAAVRGLQGTGLAPAGRVAATLKHFVGYSQPLNGQDRSPALIPLRTLREVFLPPFEAGIEAGARTVMVNSGSVNGVPVHASRYLLTDVLRKGLGFSGVVVSDWQDIHKLQSVHRVAPTFREAVRLGIMAGVDMYMVPLDAAGFTQALISLVEEGMVPRDRIDEAVRRILTLKFELGLFENPYVDPSKARAAVEAGKELARRAAAESITLLKNKDNVLPLSHDVGSILVTGPSAGDVASQLGGWTVGWQGVSGYEVPPAVTVLEGLRQAAPLGTKVNYVPGWSARGDFTEVIDAARRSDVIVAVVGETPYAEGPGDAHIQGYELPPGQKALTEKLASTGTPLVVVLIAGRPLLIAEVVRAADAVVMAYLPGSEGGTAVAGVLFGKVNPSGKLPFSWPRDLVQVPLFYNHLRGEEWPTPEYDPLFPFGYGLSYTRYEYAKLTATGEAAPDGVAHVSVAVTNTGRFEGDQVVQVYASREYSSVLRPIRQLVAFERVHLQPGETRTVHFDIPLSRLAVIPGDILGDADPIVETGVYRVMVGGLAAEVVVRQPETAGS
ncbi:MAG: glycoside hydrolase family 3 N-terminal domain-containing protein [Bacillota bacterium]